MSFEKGYSPASFIVGNGGSVHNATADRVVLSLPGTGTPTANSQALWLPSSYAGGTITATISVAMATATSGNVGLTLAFRALDGLITRAFATAQTATQSRGANADTITQSTITFSSSQIDAIVAGDPFQLQIGRDNTVGTNASGAAYIVALKLVEA